MPHFHDGALPLFIALVLLAIGDAAFSIKLDSYVRRHYVGRLRTVEFGDVASLLMKTFRWTLERAVSVTAILSVAAALVVLSWASFDPTSPSSIVESTARFPWAVGFVSAQIAAHAIGIRLAAVQYRQMKKRGT